MSRNLSLVLKITMLKGSERKNVEHLLQTLSNNHHFHRKLYHIDLNCQLKICIYCLTRICDVYYNGFVINMIHIL